MGYRLRIPLFVVGSFLIALVAVFVADRTFYAMLQSGPRQIPSIVRWLLMPGEAITFLCILGDSGTDAQQRFWVIATSTSFYTCFGFVVAMLGWLTSRSVFSRQVATSRS